MRRRGVPAVALALGVAAGTWAAGGGETATGPTRGELVSIEGEVTLDGRECETGQAVQTGATIRTGPASTCDIVFGSHTVMRLREKTTVVFDLEPQSLGVRMPAGSLAVLFNKVRALGRTFRVSTNSAIAGVRGTSFFVQVEDENSTYVCACYGEVGVAARGVADTVLASTNHSARRFTLRDGSTRIENPGLLYHDNALMESVAARIGATIPWGKGGYGEPVSGGYRD